MIPNHWKPKVCERPFLLPQRKRFLVTFESPNPLWGSHSWTCVKYGGSVQQVEHSVLRDAILTMSSLKKVEEINDN